MWNPSLFLYGWDVPVNRWVDPTTNWESAYYSTFTSADPGLEFTRRYYTNNLPLSTNFGEPIGTYRFMQEFYMLSADEYGNPRTYYSNCAAPFSLNITNFNYSGLVSLPMVSLTNFYSSYGTIPLADAGWGDVPISQQFGESYPAYRMQTTQNPISLNLGIA
jgi:hypothetical protein